MIYFQKNFGYKLIQYVSTIKHKKIKNRRDGRHCHWLISYGMTHSLDALVAAWTRCPLPNKTSAVIYGWHYSSKEILLYSAKKNIIRGEIPRRHTYIHRISLREPKKINAYPKCYSLDIHGISRCRSSRCIGGDITWISQKDIVKILSKRSILIHIQRLSRPYR